MSKTFTFGVILHCFLHGLAVFAYNVSTSNVSVEDIDSMDQYSPFLQLRASLPSYSKPIQPYSLQTNREDYHYMPKPKQRRPSHLLRLLGAHFDSFWMSVDAPSQSTGVWRSERDQAGDSSKSILSTGRKMFNLSSSPQLKLAEENHRLKIVKEAADLDLSSLPTDVATAVRDWLVKSATCELHYQWVDLGLVFWPRWLRHTDCDRMDLTRKCSFPSGMVCKRAQTTQIRILAWHCQELIEKPYEPFKYNGFDAMTLNGTVKNKKMCRWRQVPYPVVTACACSCE